MPNQNNNTIHNNSNNNNNNNNSQQQHTKKASKKNKSEGLFGAGFGENLSKGLAQAISSQSSLEEVKLTYYHVLSDKFSNTDRGADELQFAGAKENSKIQIFQGVLYLIKAYNTFKSYKFLREAFLGGDELELRKKFSADDSKAQQEFNIFVKRKMSYKFCFDSIKQLVDAKDSLQLESLNIKFILSGDRNVSLNTVQFFKIIECGATFMEAIADLNAITSFLEDMKGFDFSESDEKSKSLVVLGIETYINALKKLENNMEAYQKESLPILDFEFFFKLSQLNKLFESGNALCFLKEVDSNSLKSAQDAIYAVYEKMLAVLDALTKHFDKTSDFIPDDPEVNNNVETLFENLLGKGFSFFELLDNSKAKLKLIRQNQECIVNFAKAACKINLKKYQEKLFIQKCEEIADKKEAKNEKLPKELKKLKEGKVKEVNDVERILETINQDTLKLAKEEADLIEEYIQLSKEISKTEQKRKAEQEKERKAEQERKRKEEEQERKRKEVEQKRKHKEEEQERKRKEVEQKRKHKEAEQKRKHKEAEQKRKHKEVEQKRKHKEAEQERKRKEADQKRKPIELASELSQQKQSLALCESNISAAKQAFDVSDGIHQHTDVSVLEEYLAEFARLLNLLGIALNNCCIDDNVEEKSYNKLQEALQALEKYTKELNYEVDASLDMTPLINSFNELLQKINTLSYWIGQSNLCQAVIDKLEQEVATLPSESQFSTSNVVLFSSPNKINSQNKQKASITPISLSQ